MTQAKHTPGPWSIDLDWSQTTGPVFSIREQKGNEDSEEAEANARLIAATPELLEKAINAERLLSHITPEQGLPSKTLNELRIAIAKATEQKVS